MSGTLFDGEFYKRLNNLKVRTNIQLTAGISGSRKSRAKGSSLEFSDFREYLLGDDIRHIDWNAYGRMDKLFVKLYKEEKEGRFGIFLDASKSMTYGEPLKSIYACQVAAAFAYIILGNLDRVRLTTFSDAGRFISKGLTGRQAFPRIIRQLEDAVFEQALDIEQLLPWEALNGRGVSIVISDFYTEQKLESLVRRLVYKKQEVILIQILSPQELNPKLTGTVQLLDMENGTDMKVTMTASVLRKYQTQMKAFTGRLKEICRKYGAHYVLAPTDMPIDQLFFEKLGRLGVFG